MTDAPTAEVLTVRGRFVTVACPYCGNAHEHTIERLGRTEHRAPGCGLYLASEQRAAGYRFRTETPT